MYHYFLDRSVEKPLTRRLVFDNEENKNNTQSFYKPEELKGYVENANTPEDQLKIIVRLTRQLLADKMSAEGGDKEEVRELEKKLIEEVKDVIKDHRSALAEIVGNEVMATEASIVQKKLGIIKKLEDTIGGGEVDFGSKQKMRFVSKEGDYKQWLIHIIREKLASTEIRNVTTESSQIVITREHERGIEEKEKRIPKDMQLVFRKKRGGRYEVKLEKIESIPEEVGTKKPEVPGEKDKGNKGEQTEVVVPPKPRKESKTEKIDTSGIENQLEEIRRALILLRNADAELADRIAQALMELKGEKELSPAAIATITGVVTAAVMKGLEGLKKGEEIPEELKELPKKIEDLTKAIEALTNKALAIPEAEINKIVSKTLEAFKGDADIKKLMEDFKSATEMLGKVKEIHESIAKLEKTNKELATQIKEALQKLEGEKELSSAAIATITGAVTVAVMNCLKGLKKDGEIPEELKELPKKIEALTSAVNEFKNKELKIPEAEIQKVVDATIGKLKEDADIKEIIKNFKDAAEVLKKVGEIDVSIQEIKTLLGEGLTEAELKKITDSVTSALTDLAKKADVDALNKGVGDLKNEVTKLKTAIETLKDKELTIPDTEINKIVSKTLEVFKGDADIKKVMADFKDAAEVLKKVGEIDVSIQEIKTLLGEGLTEAELKKITDSVTSALTDLAKKADVDALNKGVGDLKNEVTKLKTAIETLKDKELTIPDTEINKIVSKTLEVFKGDADIKKVMADFKDAAEVLKKVGEIDVSIQEIKTLLGEGLTEAELKKITDSVTSALTDLAKKADVDALNKGVGDLKNEVTKLKTAIETLKDKELTIPDTEINKIVSKTLEVFKGDADIKKVMADFKDAAEVLKKVNEVLTKLGDIEALKKSVEEGVQKMGSAETKIGESNTKIQEAATEIAETKKEIKKLLEEIEKTSKITLPLNFADDVKKAVREARNSVKRYVRGGVRSLQKKIKALDLQNNEEVKKVNIEIAAIKTIAEGLKNEELSKKITELQKAVIDEVVKKVKEDGDESRTKIAELKKQLDDWKVIIENIPQSFRDTVARIATAEGNLKTQLDRIEGDVGLVKTASDTQGPKIDDIVVRLSNLQEKLGNVDIAAGGVQAIFDQMKRDLDEVKRKLDSGVPGTVPPGPPGQPRTVPTTPTPSVDVINNVENEVDTGVNDLEKEITGIQVLSPSVIYKKNLEIALLYKKAVPTNIMTRPDIVELIGNVTAHHVSDIVKYNKVYGKLKLVDTEMRTNPNWVIATLSYMEEFNKKFDEKAKKAFESIIDQLLGQDEKRKTEVMKGEFEVLAQQETYIYRMNEKSDRMMAEEHKRKYLEMKAKFMLREREILGTGVNLLEEARGDANGYIVGKRDFIQEKKSSLEKKIGALNSAINEKRLSKAPDAEAELADLNNQKEAVVNTLMTLLKKEEEIESKFLNFVGDTQVEMDQRKYEAGFKKNTKTFWEKIGHFIYKVTGWAPVINESILLDKLGNEIRSTHTEAVQFMYKTDKFTAKIPDGAMDARELFGKFTEGNNLKQYAEQAAGTEQYLKDLREKVRLQTKEFHRLGKYTTVPEDVFENGQLKMHSSQSQPEMPLSLGQKYEKEKNDSSADAKTYFPKMVAKELAGLGYTNIAGQEAAIEAIANKSNIDIDKRGRLITAIQKRLPWLKSEISVKDAGAETQFQPWMITKIDELKGDETAMKAELARQAAEAKTKTDTIAPPLTPGSPEYHATFLRKLGEERNTQRV